MSAIEMLEADHREVEELFAKLGSTKGVRERRVVFDDIADKLAVHAALEEQYFYPAVKTDETEDFLFDAAEDHLAVRRVIVDLQRLDPADEKFAAQVKALHEQVRRHVDKEEDELFPQVRAAFDEETLVALEQEMAAALEELYSEGNRGEALPGETDDGPRL